MDLYVHFEKPAFIFMSSLYLYFGFSNKHFSISIQLIMNMFDNTVTTRFHFVSYLVYQGL